MKSEDLKSRKLRFSVYDVDRRRIRHSLGHVVVPLDEVDLDSTEVIWRDLEAGLHVSDSVCHSCCVTTCLQCKVFLLFVSKIQKVYHIFG